MTALLAYNRLTFTTLRPSVTLRRYTLYMLVFIDNEHASGYDKPWGEKIMAARTRIKYRLGDLSSQPCLIVRYDRVTPALLQKVSAKALFISGNSANPDDYSEGEQAGLRAVLETRSLPTFGFCGGFQVMAETYGARLGPIGTLSPEEQTAEDAAGFAPGLKKELGYLPVEVTAQHALLAGLGEAPVFRHAHSWESKDIPAGFKVYAATKTSPIQMIVHEDLPIVGTQFHPEYYTDEYPAGRVLIKNFMKWAGLLG